MISFDIPDSIKNQLQMVEMVAGQMMRPQARYFDEHEHEIPHDFINMMWPVIKDQNKRMLDKLEAGGVQDAERHEKRKQHANDNGDRPECYPPGIHAGFGHSSVVPPNALELTGAANGPGREDG